MYGIYFVVKNPSLYQIILFCLFSQFFTFIPVNYTLYFELIAPIRIGTILDGNHPRFKTIHVPHCAAV